MEVKAEYGQLQVLTPMPQGDWIKSLYMFLKLKPHIFKGETGGIFVIYWKEDMKRRNISIRAYQIQLQRLTTFS